MFKSWVTDAIRSDTTSMSTLDFNCVSEMILVELNECRSTTMAASISMNSEVTFTRYFIQLNKLLSSCYLTANQ